MNLALVSEPPVSRRSCISSGAVVALVLLTACSSPTVSDGPAIGQPSPPDSEVEVVPSSEPLPRQRPHQTQLIAALESLGLVDIVLGDTGGPKSALLLGETSGGEVGYQVGLLLDDGLGPVGEFVETGTDVVDGVEVKILDRGGPVVWFLCPPARMVEVRTNPGTVDDSLALVGELSAALDCVR